VALGLLQPAFSPPGGLLASLLLLHAAILLYYAAALRRAGRPLAQTLFLAPLIVGLSMGLSLSLSVALLRGVLGSRAAAEFVRTPKTGGAQAPVAAYRPVRDALARLEVALGLLYLGLSTVALWRGQVLAALGLGALVASGLLWVGLGSLRMVR
jgi:hypothetical protein